MPLVRSFWTVILSSLVLPPAGLVLVWMQKWGLPAKLGASLLTALLGIGHLFLFYGMRIELRGGGTPSFNFHNPRRHIEALERSRSAPAPAPRPEATLIPAKADATPEPAASMPSPAAPSPAAPPSAPWPDFRGPERDGVYRQGPILTDWPAKGLERLYKQPIGGGYASFAIANGRAYTIEQRRDREVVSAYDLNTGRELWTHSYPADFQESMGGPGPRATPTFHEGNVYALGATGEFRVLNARTGAVVWSKNILADNGAANVMWGMSAAPLIVGDKVIVQPGGSGGRSIVAYDKAAGKRIWGVLDDKAAYTSPMLLTVAGRRQIVTQTASRTVGLDPESGNLLWEYPWVTQYDVNASQPVQVAANRLFLSSGYDHGAAVIELSPSLAVKTVWENKRMKNRFNSSVLHNGYLYGMDESIMACVRASDGNQMWKGGRYGYGQILLAGDHIVVLSESGELALVKATPERHTEVAKFDAIEGKTWNVPAIAGGLLLVRNAAEMACFRLGK